MREHPHDPAIHSYVAFADESGGQGGDASTLAIVHLAPDGRIIQDLMRIWRPPFDGSNVIREKATLLKAYRIHELTLDHWAGGLPPSLYAAQGIRTNPAAPKSKIYLDLLQVLNSRRLLMLDEPTQITELCNLERRTSWGGGESIDHPSGGNSHDDAINSLAGAAVLAATKQPVPRIPPDLLRRSRFPSPRSLYGRVDGGAAFGGRQIFDNRAGLK